MGGEQLADPGRARRRVGGGRESGLGCGGPAAAGALIAAFGMGGDSDPAPATDGAPTASGRDSVTAMALVMVVWAVIACHFAARPMAGLDFYQFWLVAQVIGTPAADHLYSQETRERLGRDWYLRAQEPGAPARQRDVSALRQTLETFATPFMYTAFRLFAGGDYDRDYLRFQAVGTVVAMAAVVVLCSAFGFPVAGTCLALAMLVTPGFAPLGSDIRVGNVNRLQLAMVGAFVFLDRVHLRRGGLGWHVLACSALAATVMFKPNLILLPVLVLAGWVINRRVGRALWGATAMVGTVVVAVVVSSLEFGDVRCWIEWAGAAGWLMGHDIGTADGNVSLARLLLELGYGRHETALLVMLLASAIGCTWLGRRRANTGEVHIDDAGRALREDVLMVSLGAGIVLLAAPLAWTHYFVALIPLVLNCFRRVTGHPVGIVARRLVGMAAMLALWASLDAILMDTFGLGPGPPGPFAFQVAAASVLVVVVGLVDLATMARESGA